MKQITLEQKLDAFHEEVCRNNIEWKIQKQILLDIIEEEKKIPQSKK